MKQNEILDAFKSIAATKLSSVGGRKRNVLKEQKEIASMVIDNSDNAQVLERYRMNIIRNHKFEETEETIALLVNYIKELRKNQSYADINGEEIVEGMWLRDLTNDIPGQNVSRVMKDEDGLLYVIADGTSVWLYEIDTMKDTEIMPVVNEGTDDAQEKEVAEEGTEVGTASTDTDEPKKVTEKKRPGAKLTRKVGDIHKNGKWVWTEYMPGKFDWRTIPSQKKTPGAKKQTK